MLEWDTIVLPSRLIQNFTSIVVDTNQTVAPPRGSCSCREPLGLLRPARSEDIPKVAL